MLDQERRASYTFLHQILRERADRAFVVQFDTGVKTLPALDALNEPLVPGKTFAEK